MVVYIARSELSGNVKIGTTDRLRYRLKYLSCYHAVALTLLKTYKGGIKVEQWLHRRFSDYRVAGEWFSPDPRMLTCRIPASVRRERARHEAARAKVNIPEPDDWVRVGETIALPISRTANEYVLRSRWPIHHAGARNSIHKLGNRRRAA